MHKMNKLRLLLVLVHVFPKASVAPCPTLLSTRLRLLLCKVDQPNITIWCNFLRHNLAYDRLIPVRATIPHYTEAAQSCVYFPPA